MQRSYIFVSIYRTINVCMLWFQVSFMHLSSTTCSGHLCFIRKHAPAIKMSPAPKSGRHINTGTTQIGRSAKQLSCSGVALPRWRKFSVLNLSFVLLKLLNTYSFCTLLFSLHRGSNQTTISLPICDHWNVFGSNKQYLEIGNRVKKQNNPKHRELSLWNRFDYLDFYANPSGNCHTSQEPVVGQKELGHKTNLTYIFIMVFNKL